MIDVFLICWGVCCVLFLLLFGCCCWFGCLFGLEKDCLGWISVNWCCCLWEMICLVF